MSRVAFLAFTQTSEMGTYSLLLPVLDGCRAEFRRLSNQIGKI